MRELVQSRQHPSRLQVTDDCAAAASLVAAPGLPSPLPLHRVSRTGATPSRRACGAHLPKEDHRVSATPCQLLRRAVRLRGKLRQELAKVHRPHDELALVCEGRQELPIGGHSQAPDRAVLQLLISGCVCVYQGHCAPMRHQHLHRCGNASYKLVRMMRSPLSNCPGSKCPGGNPAMHLSGHAKPAGLQLPWTCQDHDASQAQAAYLPSCY